MSRCFLGLFVCFLLGGVSADGPLLLMTRLMRCQYDDSLSYLESSNGSHFFINQKAVDHLLFCEAIEFRIAQGCLLHSSSHTVQWRRIGEKYCSRDFSKFAYVESNSLTAKKFRRTGRKLLLHPQTNASISSELSRDGQWKDGIEKEHSHWPFSLKKMAIAIPTAFLLCCVFMCPCFRAKRKEPSDQAVLPKELYTIDSVSSVDVSTHSERIPGSPFRVPQSPLRVPPSPLRVPPSPSRFSMSPQLSRVGSVHLSINQLVKATQNFSPSNIIGEGGFGTVYKAQLPDGQVVAIKRARREHFAALRTQFSNEVDLLAKIEHRNLVRLLGYIDKGNERIIITEYVQNGTLREHLDGQHGKTLDFNQRLEISIDVAHALTYLHLYAGAKAQKVRQTLNAGKNHKLLEFLLGDVPKKPIIHRDVKSSNILLTESFRAKVADFGFAKTGPTDEDKTHISTKVKGTAGYLDPEYLKTYQLTPKSDVFSFGILLLEILSGRRPVEMKKAADERITVRWAYKKFNEGNASEVLDPMLEEVVDGELLSKILDLAFQCTAPTRADRPTMKEVVEQLWEIRKVYRSLRRE